MSPKIIINHKKLLDHANASPTWAPNNQHVSQHIPYNVSHTCTFVHAPYLYFHLHFISYELGPSTSVGIEPIHT